MRPLTLIDTSVLCEWLDVPGLAARTTEVRAELSERAIAGEQFVLPVTTLIETGNHIAQVKRGDRWAAAERYTNLLRTVVADPDGGPFVLSRVTWDASLVARLLDGDTTGQTLQELAGNGVLGAGDVAILVERDLLLAESGFSVATVWTDDARLGAYS